MTVPDEGEAPAAPSPPLALFEACVETVAGAVAAQRGGARRVELCTGAGDGGVTPGAGSIMGARERLTIPLMILVRPRLGDFVYAPTELETMRRDVEVARALQADGVVLGALRPDDSVDVDAMRMLLQAAHPMPVTFHRAIDATRDPIEALETLLALGVARVLTSGGAATAREGTRTLAAMARRAGDACTVMAGGRVRPDHVAALVRETGVREVHARLVTRLEDGREETDEAAVGAMVGALAG